MNKLQTSIKTSVLFYFFYIGSGKSCTMYGHGSDIGILKRSVRFLLNASHKISLQMVEIYGSQVFDCLGPSKIDVTSSNGNKASQVIVESSKHFDSMLQGALQHRTQKATNQNETSSRSHAITKIILDGSRGILLFADLAGFENIDGKENRQETNFINQSLLELNKVMLAVSQEAQNVPVCTSALTKFFKPHFCDGDIVMLYHLHATSSGKITSGLGYIKELTCKRKFSAKLNARSKQLSTAKASQATANKRLIALQSRIARYRPLLN